MTHHDPELDQHLADLSAQSGKLVFGILWTAGRPHLVVQDPAAALDVEC